MEIWMPIKQKIGKKSCWWQSSLLNVISNKQK